MRPVPSTRRAAGGRRTPAVVVLVLGLGVLAGCSNQSGEVVADDRAIPATTTAGSPRDLPGRREVVEVVRAWDRARSAAYAAGDVAALRRLYLPGSAAGTADVRMLRGYLDRGVRVEGMRMQLLAVHVLLDRPRRLRLRVTDRVVGAVAVGAGSRTRLPGDNASTRVLELRRSGGAVRWRVAWVRDVSR